MQRINYILILILHPPKILLMIWNFKKIISNHHQQTFISLLNVSHILPVHPSKFFHAIYTLIFYLTRIPDCLSLCVCHRKGERGAYQTRNASDAPVMILIELMCHLSCVAVLVYLNCGFFSLYHYQDDHKRIFRFHFDGK